MLATNRTWRFTRLIPAVWCGPAPAAVAEVAPAAVAEVAPAVEGQGVQVVAARVARAAARAGEEREVPAARAAARAVEVTTQPPITTIRLTISRARSCRNSHLPLRPISRSLLRWRKARVDSLSSIPTTCWADLNASGETRMSFISWVTCPVTVRKEAATRLR